MRQYTFIAILLCSLLLSSCVAPQTEAPSVETFTGNPLLDPTELPFDLLPLDQVESHHFLPAMGVAIEQHNAEIQAIIDNPAAPNFENTIAAYDYSGNLLETVAGVFYNLLSTVTDDELDAVADIIEPLVAEHLDSLTLNKALFSKVEAVYRLKDELDLNEKEYRLLEEIYRDFAENGAALPDQGRERLVEINMALASLTLQFSQNVMADVEEYQLVVEDAEELSGLSEGVISAAAEAAAAAGYQQAWLFTLQGPSIMPLLTYADNRDLRRQAATAYIMRGRNDNENNNEAILAEIVALRLEKAKLLGHETYADYATQGKMAGNIGTVEEFLNQLWAATLPVAQAEADLLQQKIYSDGHDFELAFWDWRYYAEKVRQENYDLDSVEISNYLELENVLDGLFMVIENLWGLQFEEVKGLPLYHPEVTTWAVSEADGSHIGLIYMDLHPRPGKQGGAWMSFFRLQQITPDGDFIHPVIIVNCNFPRPTVEEPALLSYNDMNTLYHEFGHALHGLFSNVTYKSFSGTSVPRDFVELPSQIMENWARSPEVVKLFARHYESGEVIPDELITKLEDSAHFNQGFTTLELLASALLDFGYHTLSEVSDLDPLAFEAEVAAQYGLPASIYYRHGSTHFMHAFSWDYAAGYYSYLWSGVLDADAFEAFVEAGDLFDQDTAQRFRNEILEKGGSNDAMDMFVAFRGREPIIEPLLKQRGLQ
jgi:peptidyl-dipeptidase Dcp